MKAPDPLPQPGAWIVTADGSTFQTVGPDDDPQAEHPSAEGLHYYAESTDEVIWTPWSDVEWCGTYEEADSVSERIAQRDAERISSGNRPRVIAHTTRWDVAIYHAPGAVVPDHLRLAVQAVIQAALRAAGIDDAAVLITDEAP